jgi:biopolymer transport protein ExbD
MKRARWAAVLALAVVGCDLRDPAAKKKEEEARKAKEREEMLARNPRAVAGPQEAAHVLVTAPEPAIEVLARPAVAMVKVSRDGVISEPSLMTFSMGQLVKTLKGGATKSSGCCQETDPPEVRAMGGAFVMLREEVRTGESSCDEPVVLDGDYKAPWSRVRVVLEVMAKAKMTRLVLATAADPKTGLRGVQARLLPDWNPAAALPEGVKQVEVDAAGKELTIAVDGTKYADVGKAADALRAAGVKEIGIHPAGPKTPLWAVSKGVELSNALTAGGAVRFVMVDR